MSIQFSRDPLRLIADLAKRVQPTEADLLYAVNRHKARILDRTARGIDVDGAPFAPYSEEGPYYYNPVGRGLRGATAKQKQAGAGRLKRGLGTGAVTSGGSLKFPSYGAFKRALGRAGVDLRGPRAPHMLQAIAAVVRGPLEIALGVYGQAAKRASAHNTGAPGRLPKRRWFGIGRDDERLIAADIRGRVGERLRR